MHSLPDMRKAVAGAVMGGRMSNRAYRRWKRDRQRELTRLADVDRASYRMIAPSRPALWRRIVRAITDWITGDS